ncbi:MAG: DUF1848 domain-containing protein [Lachnospiraceae bacterium]|nr:DUF1848 domain-containing protein [Lachnospiraceae bacterium]MDE6982060.1 DUF1848 domain-containing protein [Lachnospiraceae bacterium]
MILSASRRTDIPNYYSDWFINRIKEGFLYVRNPMNPRQVGRINLSPKVVDCIVFWTKNPKPMINRLPELSQYKYYFQFTLTGYGKDMECNLPHKKDTMIPIFQELSRRIGKEKVIWRYDPIIFTKRYTPEYHLKAFFQIADALCGYTKKCVISFVDIYEKNRRNLRELGAYELGEPEVIQFAGRMSKIAADRGMTVGSCAENIELSPWGIEHNCCIDKGLIEEITGYQIRAGKDKNQRNACGCIESVEIGAYNTCKNGCRYCYANYSQESVRKNCGMYDVNSPLLCGRITQEDMVYERKVKSLGVDR